MLNTRPVIVAAVEGDAGHQPTGALSVCRSAGHFWSVQYFTQCLDRRVSTELGAKAIIWRRLTGQLLQ